jgi:hypothetical protein
MTGLDTMARLEEGQVKLKALQEIHRAIRGLFKAHQYGRPGLDCKIRPHPSHV